MATHSIILARKLPTDRGAWRATIHGVAESDMTEQLICPKCLSLHTSLSNAYQSVDVFLLVINFFFSYSLLILVFLSLSFTLSSPPSFLSVSGLFLIY